jgi:hypothetical protein
MWSIRLPNNRTSFSSKTFLLWQPRIAPGAELCRSSPRGQFALAVPLLTNLGSSRRGPVCGMARQESPEEGCYWYTMLGCGSATMAPGQRPSRDTIGTCIGFQSTMLTCHSAHTVTTVQLACKQWTASNGTCSSEVGRLMHHSHGQSSPGWSTSRLSAWLCHFGLLLGRG